MRTRIVEHIAGNALHALREAEGEAANMRARHPLLSDATSAGPGLDLAVLREKLRSAIELVSLLAPANREG